MFELFRAILERKGIFEEHLENFKKTKDHGTLDERLREFEQFLEDQMHP